MTTAMTLKRKGRASSGAALAVLVALVALALLSRVDAQNDPFGPFTGLLEGFTEEEAGNVLGRAGRLRDRVAQAATAICILNQANGDCEGLEEGLSAVRELEGVARRIVDELNIDGWGFP